MMIHKAMKRRFLATAVMGAVMAVGVLSALPAEAKRGSKETKRAVDTMTAVEFGVPYEFCPPRYVCYRAPGEVTIDGRIDSTEWAGVPWTADFVDIQGKNRPEVPRHRCRARLMWDDRYLYIAAEMEEPHLWATLTERESVIFLDNDFEVFLDVTGTTHHYMEFEVNALGTEWDLMLTRPYRDGGMPLNAWNMNGMRSAVQLYGTLNDPSDVDERWTFEMAIPLSTLCEVRNRGAQVVDGEQWRLNFSRVQWLLDVVDGRYVKRPKMPEDNWVWAPTGKISIHEPEYWGFLQFSTVVAGEGTVPFAWDANEGVKWALRQFYFRQREFRGATGRWATMPEELRAAEITVEGLQRFEPTVRAAGDGYRIVAAGADGTSWYIDEQGYVGQGR